MKRYLSAVTLALAVSACSTPSVTPVDVVTETTTPKGLNVIQSSSRGTLPGGGLVGEESAVAQLTATVESVDLKQRVATVRTKDGRLVPLKVSPEVKNLKQVKKGDILELDFVESVEFEVRKPTPEEIELAGVELDAGALAKKGEKPGAAVISERIDILVVEKVNTRKELVTLRGPQGPVTVKAKYPDNLKVLKAGDTVVVRSSELLAARIKPVG
jgi:hypothetical protein